MQITLCNNRLPSLLKLYLTRDKLMTFLILLNNEKKYKSATQRLFYSSNSIRLKKIQLTFLPLVQYNRNFCYYP
ncbi:MAG: hypothetical protein JWQ09_5359 [Segetibacter sp.]|nr:hypothetical protein [Segetibacter sp.]